MTNKDKELIRLYGEFLVRFELVCSRLRFSLLNLLYPKYTNTEKNICEIMTEGLTADPLRKKFVALIIERFSKTSEIYKVADRTSKIFLNLIDLRNSFAHGTAFIGEHDFIQETKKGKLVIRHPKIKADGLDLNFKSFDSKLLKSLIQTFEKLEITISRITVLIKLAHYNESGKEKFYEAIYKDLDSIDPKTMVAK
ncbi:MAG TPA: hypothetical protein VFF27_03100 [Bacteroidia bacterium]|jgi:hypothetical protein|nr:hypothetical protein [Bacteroidia bacterium]